MVKKLFLLLSITSVTALSTPSASAQSSDGGSDAKYIRNSVNLLPQDRFSVDFFNTPSISETDFVMRMIVPGDISGCAEVIEPFISTDQKKRYNSMISGVQQKAVSGTLKVSQLRPKLVLDDQDPRYAHHDCDIQHSSAYIDINLNRDDLIKKHVEKIKLEVISYDNEEDFGEYKIDVNKERFIFEGKSPEGPVWFTQWFFPKSTIIVHAPQAKIGKNVENLIRELGVSQGLTPLEEHFKEYEPPHDANNYVIFVDNTHHVLNQIKSLDDNVMIGNIKPTRTRFTASGETVETYDLPVYARKLGRAE